VNAPPDPDQLVLLGAIGAPRGIKGDVRVKSFTAEPGAIASYGPLWDKKGARWLTLKVVGEAKGQVIVRVAGIADRTQAEALRGTELFVPRERLPQAEEDAFYYVDLIGLRVETTEGEFLGEVRTVFEAGAGDLLDVGGGPYRGLVVPFTRDVVTEVDLEAGRLLVDPPDGLLEPPEDEAKPKPKRKHRREDN
jgi:16S rRNA processing protein RimM